MTAAQQAAAALRNWLDQPEGYDYLLRFVGSMARSAATRPANVLETLSASEQADARQDLCHDFLVFLLDHGLAALHRHPEQAQLLLAGQYRRVLELAWGRFAWRQQDRERSRDLNPRGYLYRRLREILRQDKQFVLVTTARKYPCYHPAQVVLEGHEIFLDATEAARSAPWPAPQARPGQTPERYLFAADWLVETSLLFWEAVRQRAGRPVAVPIRDLVSYLAEHHPWLNRPLRQEGDVSDMAERLDSGGENPEERCQRLAALRAIGPLAAQLAATWTGEQRRVFALRLDTPPPSFREIGERLGIADHNRAYALYQRSVTSLQRFTDQWPGPPLAELPVEVAETFVEEMRRICKNSPDWP